jgi:hypothetical protein
MGRPLGMHLREHQYNLTQGLIEKPTLAKHAYDEGHHIIWKEAKVLQVESNHIRRKYKELPDITCAIQPISQPSLKMLLIWTPHNTKEVSNVQGTSA